MEFKFPTKDIMVLKISILPLFLSLCTHLSIKIIRTERCERENQNRPSDAGGQLQSFICFTDGHRWRFLFHLRFPCFQDVFQQPNLSHTESDAGPDGSFSKERGWTVIGHFLSSFLPFLPTPFCLISFPLISSFPFSVLGSTPLILS